MGDSAAYGQPPKHSVTQLDAGTPTSLERSYGVIDLADVPEAFRALERPSTQCKVLIEFT